MRIKIIGVKGGNNSDKSEKDYDSDDKNRKDKNRKDSGKNSNQQ